ncbi:hypothetical protein K0P33_07610 [Pseudomonas sp. ArH3a]|uniref:hypothetical protein n=1 Tax=Pseudomonas TaxID=286 RepID=UPI000B9FC88D|nr:MULTISPECIES: hypothetical protein [unclassified Pseudomonas]MCV2229717.1 hypothetical protein [Pseudomonas sp. AU10]OZO05115.1 hypothetical protein B7453_07285 [Pseudomonas sp. IB20]UNM21313.1 hypothetical protein K0P33_07610 [Pseudomonas sp. ArH3a]
MMKIKLFPFLTDEPLTVCVEEEVMTLCGQVIDLSVIPEGYRLPASATGCDHFVEYVERINGTLCLTLKLPVRWNSPESLRNPAKPLVIEVTTNGPVELPASSLPKAPPVPPVEGLTHD